MPSLFCPDIQTMVSALRKLYDLFGLFRLLDLRDRSRKSAHPLPKRRSSSWRINSIHWKVSWKTSRLRYDLRSLSDPTSNPTKLGNCCQTTDNQSKESFTEPSILTHKSNSCCRIKSTARGFDCLSSCPSSHRPWDCTQMMTVELLRGHLTPHFFLL